MGCGSANSVDEQETTKKNDLENKNQNQEISPTKFSQIKKQILHQMRMILLKNKIIQGKKKVLKTIRKKEKEEKRRKGEQEKKKE